MSRPWVNSSLSLKKGSGKRSYINAFKKLFPYVRISAACCHLKIKSALILGDLRIKSALSFLLPLGEKVQVEGELKRSSSRRNVDTVVNSGFESYPSFGG